MDKAIAKFMELETSKEPYLSYSRTMYLVRGYWWPLRKLKYSTSWDWLMPVVRKIKYDKGSLIRMESNGIKDSVMPYVKAMQPMNRALIKADQQGVYDGVYQFIQWYNQSNA